MLAGQMSRTSKTYGTPYASATLAAAQGVSRCGDDPSTTSGRGSLLAGVGQRRTRLVNVTMFSTRWRSLTS